MLGPRRPEATDVARRELRLFLIMADQAGMDTNRQHRSLLVSPNVWHQWLGILNDAPDGDSQEYVPQEAMACCVAGMAGGDGKALGYEGANCASAGCVAPTNGLIWAAAAKIGTVAGKQRHGL